MSAEHDWDEMANEYEVLLRHMEPAFIPVTERLLDLAGVHAGQRVLELGCGLGTTTAAATKRGVDALGIDLSGRMIEKAAADHPHCRFQVGDMMTPPPGPWDAIVSRFAAHHAPQGWLDAAISALAAGGRLAIAEFEPDGEEAEANGMRPPAYWQRSFLTAGLVDVRLEQVRVETPPAAAKHGHADHPGLVFVVVGTKPAGP